MKPFTFGLIIFLEIMLLDGIFAASTIKQRPRILPFVTTPFYGEDYNQEDVIQINISQDQSGNAFGETQGDQQALVILTGKSVLTEAELEDAISTFYGSEVTFNDEKTKGKP